MSKEAHTFYWPKLNEQATQVLLGDEAVHALKVMRVKLGADIRLVDGKGNEGYGSVTRVAKKELEFELSQFIKSLAEPSGFHLAIAPTKQIDRLEWCVEKCTEIGLSRISPIICQNSERRHLRIDRLERIAISAMKQSGSCHLPIIDEAIPLAEFLAQYNGETPLLIAHCREEDRVDLKDFGGKATVLIGPEGDFTHEEIEQALGQGAKAVHLGAKRLRTETAGLVACTLMNLT